MAEILRTTGGPPMPTFSLRIKYALLVNLFILVPMVVYLVWDRDLEHQSILENRLEVLRNMGQLVVEQAALDSDEDLQLWLSRFAARQPQLEIYVLDREQRVRACTLPHHTGRVLREEAIGQVLEGLLTFTWDLGYHHENLPVLEITLPIAAPPGAASAIAGAIHIAEPQATLEREIRKATIRSTLFVLLLMALMAGLVTLVTDRLIIRRILHITTCLANTEWLANEAVWTHERDELSVLSTVLGSMIQEIEQATGKLRQALEEKQSLVEQVEGFNEELVQQVEVARAELLAMQQELIRKERLSTIGELAAGLAHEIRNPLQIIQGTAEMVRRRHPGTEEALGDVVEEVARLNRLVRDLLQYARPLQVVAEDLNLAELVERVFAGVRAGLEVEDGVELRHQIPADISCYGDDDLLYRVLLNLVTNGVEALPDRHGRVDVYARNTPDGGWEVQVQDQGEGIAPEDLQRLFTPFFSRKEAGIGLGLCLSRRIVEQHGGRLELTSKPGQGATASLWIPAREQR